MVHLGGHLLAPSIIGIIGALRIEATTPDAYCPAPQVLEQVVRERLGEVEDDLTLRYTVTRNISRGETTLQIVLLGSEGEVVLERKVPLGPDGCDGSALLIAHILEAHWLGREVPESPSPPAANPSVHTSPATPAPVPSTAQDAATTASAAPIAAKQPTTPAVAPTAHERGFGPRPSAGIGIGYLLQGGGALTLHGHIPIGGDHWSLHFSLAAPLVATTTVDSTLGLEIQSVSPGGSAEVSYRVIHKHVTSLFVSIGFTGFAEVAWIGDTPESGIRSNGPEARFLWAPTAGLAIEYVLTRNWELTLGLLGGPTPASTPAFAFAPQPGLPPETETAVVLPPSPIIGLAALAFHRRF